MRRHSLLACLLIVGLSGCNADWLTGVPAAKSEPCQPEVMRQVPVTADSTVADSTRGVPVVLIGFCAK